MNRNSTEMEKAALAVLRNSGVNILEAALLAKEALVAGGIRLRASETTARKALEPCCARAM